MVSRKKTAKSKRRKAIKQGKGEATSLSTQWLKLEVKNEQDDDAILEEAIKIAATEKRALEAAAAAEERRQEDSSSDAQGRQRQTTGDAALREGNDDDDDANVRCCHGFQPSSRTRYLLCYEFVKTFGTVHDEATTHNEDGFVKGIKATEEKHPEAWNDISYIESIICFCLCTGTEHLLREEYNSARLQATLARYLQEVIAVHGNVQNDIYWTKVFELYGADEHTLVKYFRRRIPCSCLDEKYNEVKHVTKVGICFNPECPLPDRTIERCKLMNCTRCRQAQYCSIECQRADWKSHRRTCVDWNSKNQTGAHMMEVDEYQCREKRDFGAMSKALAQEWSEKVENHCTYGW
mmetsp:Transcript_7803/g.12887  ORF Transcript_7803/g.12887 Transcript_7803/m.12887 type:complete len:350 (-) Transcript_7803:52-1101(-)